jgi:hypothetical protein
LGVLLRLRYINQSLYFLASFRNGCTGSRCSSGVAAHGIVNTADQTVDIVIILKTDIWVSDSEYALFFYYWR